MERLDDESVSELAEEMSVHWLEGATDGTEMQVVNQMNILSRACIVTLGQILGNVNHVGHMSGNFTLLKISRDSDEVAKQLIEMIEDGTVSGKVIPREGLDQ